MSAFHEGQTRPGSSVLSGGNQSRMQVLGGATSGTIATRSHSLPYSSHLSNFDPSTGEEIPRLHQFSSIETLKLKLTLLWGCILEILGIAGAEFLDFLRFAIVLFIGNAYGLQMDKFSLFQGLAVVGPISVLYVISNRVGMKTDAIERREASREDRGIILRAGQYLGLTVITPAIVTLIFSSVYLAEAFSYADEETMAQIKRFMWSYAPGVPFVTSVVAAKDYLVGCKNHLKLLLLLMAASLALMVPLTAYLLKEWGAWGIAGFSISSAISFILFELAFYLHPDFKDDQLYNFSRHFRAIRQEARHILKDGYGMGLQEEGSFLTVFATFVGVTYLESPLIVSAALGPLLQLYYSVVIPAMMVGSRVGAVFLREAKVNELLQSGGMALGVSVTLPILLSAFYFPFEGRIFSAFGLGADAIALAGKASPYAVSAALSAVIFNMITGVDRRVVSLRDVRNEVRSGRVSPQGSVVVEIVSPLPEGSNRPVPMRSGCCHSSITLIPGLIRIGSLSVGCGLSIAMGLGAQLGLKGLWIGRFVGESVSAIFIGARTWTIIKFLLKQQGANAERVASTLLTQNPVNEIGDGLGGEIPVAQRAGEDLGEIYHVLNGGHIGDSQPKSPLVELSDLNGQKSTANAVFPVEHKADESELPKVVSQRFSGTIQKPIAASPAPATPLSSHLRTPPAPKTPTLTPGRRNLLPESSPNLLDLGAPASQPTVVIPVVRSAFAVVLGRGDSSQSDDEGGSLGPLTTRPSRVQAVARTLFFKEEDVQNVSGETSHGAAESYVALSPVQGGVLLPEEQGYTRFLTPNRPATGGHGPSSGSGSENSALGPSAVPFSVSPS